MCGETSVRKYVAVLGDMNASEKCGSGCVIGIYGVPDVNESGERMLDLCIEIVGCG